MLARFQGQSGYFLKSECYTCSDYGPSVSEMHSSLTMNNVLLSFFLANTCIALGGLVDRMLDLESERPGFKSSFRHLLTV